MVLFLFWRGLGAEGRKGNRPISSTCNYTAASPSQTPQQSHCLGREGRGSGARTPRSEWSERGKMPVLKGGVFHRSSGFSPAIPDPPYPALGGDGLKNTSATEVKSPPRGNKNQSPPSTAASKGTATSTATVSQSRQGGADQGHGQDPVAGKQRQPSWLSLSRSLAPTPTACQVLSQAQGLRKRGQSPCLREPHHQITLQCATRPTCYLPHQ